LNGIAVLEHARLPSDLHIPKYGSMKEPQTRPGTGAKQPAVRGANALPGEAKSSTSEISAFLKAARRTNPAGAGRIVFALDATMSRQPTWDRAMKIQASMFDSAAGVSASGDSGSGLSIQLVYFRGFGECRASKWVVDTGALRDLMTGIGCRAGETQIAKVLSHTLKETSKSKVDALVFIGDAMEENPDTLAQRAGELGLKGVRCFMFQEGSDPSVERCFREIARLSGGAWFRLGPNSARQLAELLGAIAVYARGGLKALGARNTPADRLLLEHMAK